MTCYLLEWSVKVLCWNFWSVESDFWVTRWTKEKLLLETRWVLGFGWYSRQSCGRSCEEKRALEGLGVVWGCDVEMMRGRRNVMVWSFRYELGHIGNVEGYECEVNVWFISRVSKRGKSVVSFSMEEQVAEGYDEVPKRYQLDVCLRNNLEYRWSNVALW